MFSSTENPGSYIVLGASGDLGTQVARQLNSCGHRLLLASRGSEELGKLADELQAPQRVLDASQFEQVQDCFNHAMYLYERIDGVVNCVGSLLLKPAHLTKESEWQQTIDTNLTSAFATIRAAAKSMTQHGGSVVLISSAAATVGLANHEAIAAAKAGVAGLTRSAAATYARQGIRVNAVAPGLVKSKLTRRIWESKRAADNSRNMHPLGRIGEPSEIASLVCWLLDRSNSWITGEVISIDGGLANLRQSQKQ